MSATVAIYQDLPAGRLRLGLFTYRGPGRSIYAISQAFHHKMPHAHTDGQLYIARRTRIMGRWVDDECLPMDAPDHPTTT